MNEMELAALRPLARRFASPDAALAEIARLSAELTLPKGAVHVVSDVHGEDVKLRHVVNNASGTLRPLVERLFGERMSKAELRDFLSLIFYPREMLERLEPELADPSRRHDFAQRVLHDLFTVVRALAARYPADHLDRLLPPEYAALLHEMLHDPARGPEYVRALIEPLVRAGRDQHLIRLTVRLVRDLAVAELIVAGDCVDRGPRGDRVIEYLRRQPNVSFTWGNHDVAWIGAALGQEALIAHVLRISIRYRRLSQLEEGYGITLQPLEHLVRTVYKDDPASSFVPKGTGLRETETMARMQKAAAVMQWKLEGQTIARHPEWQLDHRRLLRRLDPAAGTVEVDGKVHPLRDRAFPTLDPAHPEELSAEERKCMDRLRRSFLASPQLWQHVRFLVERGSMWLRRDDHLIFHGCVPVDEDGRFLSLTVDGQPRAGRALFDALEGVVVRSLETHAPGDLDLLWYLWSGPLAPTFGKDRITTLERDLVADTATHHETKNPYFKLIHEAAFCERVLQEFGCDPARGLIVNGHVPVKIDKGEDPLKRSGKAITIDGAFSEAYGDHGYTLVLEADRTFIGRHHHFDSVEAAVREGVDIIPTIAVVRQWDRPRRVADTERGNEIRAGIALLERLLSAYRTNALREGSPASA
jgi:fructose-1,6-bisphosphatase III